MKPKLAPNAAMVVTAIVTVSYVAARADQSTIRVATYNTSLYRDESGQLARELQPGDNVQARRIAEVIQRVRPDVLLVNEFDFDPSGQAAELFKSKYLAIPQNGCEPIDFPAHFTAPVNTGRASGRDLDHNSRPGDPGDAIGFGRHEGQYGMLVLSRYSIDRRALRTFQRFLWRDMPKAMLPTRPGSGVPFYDDGDLQQLRLSSKSFWDIPISVTRQVAAGGSRLFTLHLLCSHPTPPVFDGSEDRNGRRNHDEVRLIADFIDLRQSEYLVDDAGTKGGLPAGELFVILGDLNCDPLDGDGIAGTMDQLLMHSRVNATFIPESAGGALTVKQHQDQHAGHRGDPAHVTADFTRGGPGCLRIDYALPSRGLEVTSGGVFWPVQGEPGREAITATDHRMVWIDIRAE
jgi:endonuclease/exonuclease/phosphatase family metal-dependent hydrolase